MKGVASGRWSILAVAALLGGAATSCLGAAKISMETVDPPEANVGDQVVVTIAVQDAAVMGRVQLPPVDGLQVRGTRLQRQTITENGAVSTTTAFSFDITAIRPGDFTIPGFDIRTQEGEALHVEPMKLHVLGTGQTSDTTATAPATPVPDSTATASPPPPATPPTPAGPVVMPPNTAPPAQPAAGGDSTNAASAVPRDPDGGPAKVFIMITPQTTEGYVGQAIPMEIDFYIRMDVNAPQNSLPTIKGSDFLMNNFTVRGQESMWMVDNQQYVRETWLTAISAPKSGDFPLSMERDTYWLKSFYGGGGIDPYSGRYNQQPDLAHEMISSNRLIVHVHALPTDGKPANFTGAIGQYSVSANSQPDTVAVGEPVTLRFAVSGEGNFDYVRCPALAPDPAWKTYAPYSRTNYLDESRTHAVKMFELAVIPQKNGDLPLPAASFSYFDPGAKRYVTVPIPLPTVTVAGAIASAPTAGTTDGTASVAANASPDELTPNRTEAGSPRLSLTPAFRRPWFWGVQAGFIALPVIAALLLLLRARSAPDRAELDRALRRRSIEQEEEAMSEAVRQRNAVAFFLAARHAVQLQLGGQWGIRPETITLAEIRQRDPQLAENLEPLFHQADEVIYSTEATPGIDLAEWEARVRSELLQPS